MLCIGAPRLESKDLSELDATEFGSRFKLVAKLGQGGFADVLCVRDGPTQLAALKVLKCAAHVPTTTQQLSGRSAAPAQQAPEVSLFREARALKHAKHPNVVQLQGVVHIPRACVTDSSTSRGKSRDKGGSCWGILLELLQGGSLQQQVYKAMCQPHAAAYSQLDALTWATDIASGVAHLHSLNPVLIHRDLKLENILLRKPCPGEAGDRKLPVAKLTDFGLHVMIDRPPSPFFITTAEDGMPLLILSPEHPQQPQQDDTKDQLIDKAAAMQEPLQSDPSVPTALQHPKGPQQHALPPLEASISAGSAEQRAAGALTASSSSSPDPDADPDAEARVGPADCRSGSGSSCKAACVSALKGSASQQLTEAKAKHVAFAVDVSADVAPAACHNAADAAAAAVPACDAAADRDQQAPLAMQQQKQQQQQERLQRPSPQQWTRLTAGTLRRLSMDSMGCRSNSGASQHNPREGADSSSGSRLGRGHRGSGTEQLHVAIPLLIQPPCVGQSGSFVNAAVPSTLASLADEAAADDGTGVRSPTHNRSSSGGSSGGRGSLGGAGVQDDAGVLDGSISSILAAANSQRDYEVNLKPAALKAQQLQRLSPGPLGSYARSCTSADGSTATGTATASAAATAGTAGSGCGAASQGAAEEGPNTPRGAASISSASVRSGDWPTAASMIWEDLMEDEIDQELLLDGGMPAVGSGHGALIELSYNLTGHTGSFMYMAPEVYQRKPYNESVDVFSMGVMFYELFSRTLLIYTHTPANSAADCERYAAQIAKGFRPKRPKSVPAEVWALIEACWEQDPMERPPAQSVLQTLQQLLRQAQAEGAAAKSSGGRKHLGKLFGSGDKGAAAAAAAGAGAGTEGPKGAQPKGQDAGGRSTPEPACGCVIC